MYTLSVSDFVMIAHSLAGDFFGPAQRMHGATLTVDAEIRTPELESHGVVMDIGVLRQRLRSVLEPLDYRNLDDHPAFPPRGSTTERIARHLAEALSAELGSVALGTQLKITVHESPVARVAYELEL
jgi:6-pyruvoyl-tetrahydropterin synthase